MSGNFYAMITDGEGVTVHRRVRMVFKSVGGTVEFSLFEDSLSGDEELVSGTMLPEEAEKVSKELLAAAKVAHETRYGRPLHTN